MAVGGWILLSGPQGAPYTDATLLYAESDALRQLSQLTSNTISIKPMSVWRFSNFPTRRNFNCFRRKSSPESCGIQVAHFNCMLAVGRTGAPEKYQVRLTLARRADPANKSGTNARWEFWGKWSLKLLTQKLIMSKISGLWLRETLSLLPFYSLSKYLIPRHPLWAEYSSLFPWPNKNTPLPLLTLWWGGVVQCVDFGPRFHKFRFLYHHTHDFGKSLDFSIFLPWVRIEWDN